MNNSLSVLKALSYFDLFDYPLTRDEIGQFMDERVSAPELDCTLRALANARLVMTHKDYYSLRNVIALVKRREAGNERASHLLPKAMRISSFLYQFPFVRGIGISGSLSKNFADERADLDYFVITERNKLWIARTIMHVFKKLTFLVGKQHDYCMNYFVDEEALAIQERNAFTAVEVATLIPVCGNGSMENFFKANTWIDLYYPNYVVDVESRRNSKPTLLKKTLERITNLFPADRIDNFLFKITTNRWKKKEEKQQLNTSGRRMGLHTDKHFSKPNPDYFQKRIVDSYERKCTELRDKMQFAKKIV
jgi:hypothetical protein